MEAHSGTKAARPGLMVVCGAGLLAGALGLAWAQVSMGRALGPEERIGRTPLFVRLPHGWIRDPSNPRAFMLPIPSEGERRTSFGFERRIRFDFEDLGGQPSPEQLLRLLQLNDPRTRATVRAAHLGPFEATEVHDWVTLRIGRRLYQRETIVRFACLPQGYLIRAVYEPLIDLRPADFEIMDEVCATLRLDEGQLGALPAGAAGLAANDRPPEVERTAARSVESAWGPRRRTGPARTAPAPGMP